MDRVRPRTRGRLLLAWGATLLVAVALAVLLLARVHTAQQHLAALPQGSSLGNALVGKPAPDFTLPLWNGATTGKTLALHQLQGHPAVVNFWEASCDPCREEAPRLANVSRAYMPRGVAFVGVAFLTSRDDGTAFLRQYGITYPCGADEALAIAPAYGITGIPVTVVLDAHGVVRQEYAGPISEAALGHALDTLLAA